LFFPHGNFQLFLTCILFFWSQPPTMPLGSFFPISTPFCAIFCRRSIRVAPLQVIYGFVCDTICFPFIQQSSFPSSPPPPPEHCFPSPPCDVFLRVTSSFRRHGVFAPFPAHTNVSLTLLALSFFFLRFLMSLSPGCVIFCPFFLSFQPKPRARFLCAPTLFNFPCDPPHTGLFHQPKQQNFSPKISLKDVTDLWRVFIPPAVEVNEFFHFRKGSTFFRTSNFVLHTFSLVHESKYFT